MDFAISMLLLYDACNMYSNRLGKKWKEKNSTHSEYYNSGFHPTHVWLCLLLSIAMYVAAPAALLFLYILYVKTLFTLYIVLLA